MVSPTRIALGGAPDVEPVSTADLRVGFRASYVIEIIEEGNPNAIDTHVFPLNPSGYVLSEPFTSVLTPGDDDAVVPEENGIIIREITLTGTPGYAVKTSPKFQGVGGREVGGVQQSGNLHFLALRQLFRRYSSLKKDPARASRIQMIFHSLKDDDHFVVIPRQFETPRDARTTRFHYEYRITMAAIAESDRDFEGPDDPFGLSDPLRVIGEAFNDARSFFAEITADISQLKRKIGNIQAVMINVGGFLNSVGNFVRGTTETIEFGLQQAVTVIDELDASAEELSDSLLDSTFGTFGNAVRSMRKLTMSLQRIAAFGDRFENAAEDQISRLRRIFAGERGLTFDDIENQEAGASPAVRTRISRGSEGRGARLPTPVGVRTVVVRRGDTITSISTRESVPPEIVIVLNDLEPPYIIQGGGPRQLRPGDDILIPVFDSVRDDSDGGLNPSAEYLTPDEALYGRDLALDSDLFEKEQLFDIKVDLARGGYDAETISGLGNLVQGVLIIIETERGQTVYISDLGIRRTPGIAGTVRHLVLASLNLRSALLQDPRIEDIQDSRVVLDGDVVLSEATPVVRGRRDQVTLIRPIGTASGV